MWQIENNDPELKKLTIGPSNYLPPDGDWERVGQGIGRNEHIKELRFGERFIEDATHRAEFKSFCEGLACNNSVEQLEIECDQLFDGEIFEILTPFFEQNSNLCSLKVKIRVIRTHNLVMQSVRFLSAALLRFNTLKEFKCYGGRLGDGNIESIVRALVGHSGLTIIILSGNEVGGSGAARALAALLNKPDSSLEELELGGCSIDNEGVGVLTDALARNRTLRKLDISQNRNVTVMGWRGLLTQLLSPEMPLEKLELWDNSFDNEAANLLVTALANSKLLKALDLSESHSITTEGWRALFAELRNPRCVLQELNLRDNLFRNEDVTYLMNCLANNCVLRHLDLSVNYNVTASGWMAFAAVLQNPISAMEKLDLGYNNISNDALISLANSLMHNNKLKELFLDYDEDDTTIRTWGGFFSTVLCDKLSINTTFDSNHTLQRVCDDLDNSNIIAESDLPSDLQALLKLNRENTPIDAARRKILSVHFSGGDFNMPPFIDMDLKLLPQAIAWMARDQYGSSLLYQFVRNTMLFVGVGGAAV